MFAGPLTLSYGALPMYAKATIGPSVVTLAAGGRGDSVLTINTLATAANLVPVRPGSQTSGVVFSALVLVLLPLMSRRRRLAKMFLAVVAGIAAQSLIGCTNAYYIAHTVAPATYIVPVTAADTNGNYQTANLTVIVTP